MSDLKMPKFRWLISRKEWHEAHEGWREKIHNTRWPLSKRGIKVMTVVYLGAPLLLGYGIMEVSNWYARTYVVPEILARQKKEGRVLNDVNDERVVAAQKVFEMIDFNKTHDTSTSRTWTNNNIFKLPQQLDQQNVKTTNSPSVASPPSTTSSSASS